MLIDVNKASIHAQNTFGNVNNADTFYNSFAFVVEKRSGIINVRGFMADKI